MEFLFLLRLGKPLWMWLAFLAIGVTLLALDLGATVSPYCLGRSNGRT